MTTTGNSGRLKNTIAQIKVPALHVAAWYDLFQDGTFRNYMGIKAHGGSEAARKGQRLLVIVGGHAGHGPDYRRSRFRQGFGYSRSALTLRWYDYLLKGIDNGMGSEKPVKLFVMGKNTGVKRTIGRWRAPEKPAITCTRRAKPIRFSGDGTLSTDDARHRDRGQVCLRPRGPCADSRWAALLRRDSRTPRRFRPAARGEPRRRAGLHHSRL